MTRSSTSVALSLAASLSFSLVLACDGGTIGDPGARGGGGVDDPALACAESRNDEVRLRLAPTCAACHGAGTARPFFATLAAFEDLLAYDPDFVVRGDPDASPLIALLEGRGIGAYPQMPLVGDPFATLASRGETGITMDELRAWVRDLPPPDPSRSGPNLGAPATRRLTANEVIEAIQVALGQEPTGGVPPLLRVNGPQPLSPDSPRYVDYNDEQRLQTYLMLGGGSHLQQRTPEAAWSPSSLMTLTQVAQAACAAAAESDNPHLFHDVGASDRLPEAATAVRANIAYLYERFLHVPPADAEVDAFFTNVYAPAEATGTRVAWTQVCAALIRDPLFITF